MTPAVTARCSARTTPARRRSGDAPRLVRGGVLALGITLWAPSGCAAVEDPPLPSTDPPAASTGQQAGAGSANRPAFGRALVIFRSDTIFAEVASTPAEREHGLMYRSELPEGTGMIFVFTDEEYRSFWMSNTYVALDLAYLDSNLRIIAIEALEPESTDLHDSPRPIMYALEVPRGWFAAHGVGVGDRARLRIRSR